MNKELSRDLCNKFTAWLKKTPNYEIAKNVVNELEARQQIRAAREYAAHEAAVARRGYGMCGPTRPGDV